MVRISTCLYDIAYSTFDARYIKVRKFKNCVHCPVHFDRTGLLPVTPINNKIRIENVIRFCYNFKWNGNSEKFCRYVRIIYIYLYRSAFCTYNLWSTWQKIQGNRYWSDKRCFFPTDPCLYHIMLCFWFRSKENLFIHKANSLTTDFINFFQSPMGFLFA